MADAFVAFDNNMLTVGNGWLERRFHARAGEAFRTTAFVNRQTGRDYARGTAREFAFAANGQMLTTDDFVLQSVARYPQEAIVHLESPLLAIDLHFRIYADHPVLRKWLIIHNRGQTTIALTDLDWEVVNLLVDTPATAEAWTDYFSRRAKSVIVTMDDCALVVNDDKRGEGFIIATEAPGPMKRMEVYAQGSQIALGYNRDDETIFERILAPGEQFQTAASFILPFENPIPQDVIDGPYARFVTAHLTVCDVAQAPTITINTWIPHLYNIHRALLLAEIDRAAELGVDAYQVDAGWYHRMGDWNANRDKFPNGLEEIAEHARARGMRFGLWLAVATVDELSQVYREHPEWIALNQRGEPNRHPVPGTATMCLDSGYYDFILAKIDDVVRRYGVELLKLDLSVVRNLYEPGAHPGCFATQHAHRSPNESHLRILERLFDLIRALKRAHPRCLVDLSYELYGVMDGTDLALTQVADQNWFTNQTSPNEINLRREIWQRGRVTAPWTLNFGGAVLNAASAPHYGLFSALTSHAIFWGHLADLDAERMAHYRRWFAWLKHQRARGDFYRYYQVSNVLPTPDGISSRDYRHAIPAARYGVRPLGIHAHAFDPVSDHPGGFWDGVARLDERGEGPIFLFRPAACITAYFQLRIPWVERSVVYRIQDVTESRELGVFGGDELIEQGVEVHIAEAARAKVIVLRRE
ncbi:MAG: alpha-galactosidase [Chloroflexi bacterium]|nr:alpha-galactosidase [Chloroflexota bacterium]